MEQLAARLWVRSLGVVVAATFAALVLLAPFPLTEPVSLGGDTLEHAALVESASWLGEPGTSDTRGAPYGLDWSWAPSGGERIPLAAMAILADLSGGLWSGINLFLVAGVAATALVSFLVLRWMGASDLISACGGVVFSLLSPVIDHVELGHLFLFALWPVPLTVYLALRWTGWESPRWRDGPQRSRSTVGRLGPSALAVAAIALSSTYYALFAVLLIAMLATAVAVRRWDWRAAVPGVAAAGSIAAVLVLSSLPGQLSDAPRLERRLSDSIRFALDPLEVLLPQSESILGVTAGWGSSPASAIGLAGAAGLVLLGFWLIRHDGREAAGWGLGPRLARRLAFLAAAALAVGVAGGIGWLIARFGAQELRAWSRTSVVLSFVGIAVLSMWATAFATAGAHGDSADDGVRRGTVAYRGGAVVLVVALTVGALLEQRSQLPDPELVRAQLEEDRALQRGLQRAYPAGSEVFVMPAGTLLNDLGPGRMLGPGTGSGDLSWSAGSFRGGSGGWQHTWALEDPGAQAVLAAAGGFEALAWNPDSHLLDDPEATRADLETALGEPTGRTPGGDWEWFDLEALRSELTGAHGSAAMTAFAEAALRPLGVILHGTPGFPSAGAERDAVMGEQGAIEVWDHSSGDAEVLVAFELLASPGSVVELSAGDESSSRTIAPDGAPQLVVVEVPVGTDGRGELSIRADGQPLRAAGEDPAVYVSLEGIQAFDATLVDSEVLVPAALR